MIYVHNDAPNEELSGEGIVAKWRSRPSGEPFSTPITDAEALECHYSPLTDNPPTYNHATQKAVRGANTCVNGTWQTNWAVADLTAEQLAALVPESCDAVVGEVVLIEQGLWAQVQAFVATLAPVQQAIFQKVQTWHKSSPTFQAIAAGSGLNPAQVDALMTATIGRTL